MAEVALAEVALADLAPAGSDPGRVPMTEDPSPLAMTSSGVRLVVRLQPGASRNAIEGLDALADGRRVLRVRVGAPPEGGKANAALIALLAKAWRLPKGSLSVVAGQRDRLKTIAVTGEPAALSAQLATWLDGLSAKRPPKQARERTR